MIDTTSFLCVNTIIFFIQIYLANYFFLIKKLLSSAQSFYKEKKRSYENNNINDIEYNRWTFLPIKDSLNKVPSMLGLCIRQVDFHNMCTYFF